MCPTGIHRVLTPGPSLRRWNSKSKLKEELKALNGGLKFQLALKVDLQKANPDGGEEYTDPVLRHKQEAILQKGDIKAALHQAFPRVQEILEKWTQRGSGWVVDQVHTLWLDIARYQPLWGSSYIDLPAAGKSKKAVVKVKNKDDHCLRWALRSALLPVVHGNQAYQPTKYPTNDGLDFTGIDAPTPISQIPKVERQNNLAINVFGWDKGVIVHHISKQPEDMPRANLLLIEKAGKFHYTWIKDLNCLLYDQSKHREKKHFCELCLHGFSREDLLEAHKPDCQGIGQTAVRVEMPEEGKNKLLRSEKHHIYGQHLNKVLLSPFDSKRWIAENGVDTIAYGHKDALPAGAAELLRDVWESHQGAVECQ